MDGYDIWHINSDDGVYDPGREGECLTQPHGCLQRLTSYPCILECLAMRVDG